MNTLQQRIMGAVRTVPDFPKPGIMFQDITPLLTDHMLCRDMVEAMANHYSNVRVDAVAGVESRGFLFGFMLAQMMQKPFVLIRKKGKLPAETLRFSYALEYGNAEIEMHKDSVNAGDHILIHDDLLATGGTAAAAAELIKAAGGHIAGFTFLIELSELKGVESLKGYSQNIFNLVAS
jgi:adenine phosphoribosyltransferase